METKSNRLEIRTRCALCCRWTQKDDSLPTSRGPVHFRCVGVYQLAQVQFDKVTIVHEDGTETQVR